MDVCRICGAPRDPLNTNCKFCETAYQLSNLTGEAYINALRTILTRIDEGVVRQGGRVGTGFFSEPIDPGPAKVSAISTFLMPSDIESLLQFLAFCHGNAQMSTDTAAEETVVGAWRGKAKMAFAQLKMKSVVNPTLAAFVAEYEPLYGVRARAPMAGYYKKILYALAFLVLLTIFAGVMASGESKEKAAEQARLDAVIQQVQSQISSGQYVAAEAATANIHWTWQLNYLESQELAKVYDRRREEILAAIAEARRRSPEAR